MKERRWLELGVRVPTSPDHGSLLADALLELGGRAVEEREGWLFTHVEAPGDAPVFEERARAHLEAAIDGELPEVRIRWRDHVDWSEAWKRGLGARRITDRLVVRPSWHPVEARPGDIVIVLDPGMAFGTAEHGTTRGCLRLLDRAVVPGSRVADVGAGSGILSIAAAGLGATQVIALEGDPLAIEVLEDNVRRNGALHRVQWQERWVDASLMQMLAPLEGIVANLESGILRALLPGFAAALADSGWLILSGILRGEWEGMERDTTACGFETVASDLDGEWQSGWFVRRALT
jgi:ribosomal protein L11 methyltransferase